MEMYEMDVTVVENDTSPKYEGLEKVLGKSWRVISRKVHVLHPFCCNSWALFIAVYSAICKHHHYACDHYLKSLDVTGN